MQVDITKSSSLDTRLGPIKEIGNIVGGGVYKDIQNLIFAIANAGDYMVASNMKEQILTGLTSLCAAYMFEDYAETFAQFNSETSNKQLHLYFISGKYYTISDILTLTRDSLKPSGKNTYVKISFAPTKANEFKANEVVSLHGQPKWEAVRINTLKHGSMSIRLNTRALLNAIYPGGF